MNCENRIYITEYRDRVTKKAERPGEAGGEKRRPELHERKARRETKEARKKQR
jgi:hypothetical protein